MYKFTFFVKILEKYVILKQKVSKSTFKLTSSRTQAACLPDSLRTKDMFKFKFFRKFFPRGRRNQIKTKKKLFFVPSFRLALKLFDQPTVGNKFVKHFFTLLYHFLNRLAKESIKAMFCLTDSPGFRFPAHKWWCVFDYVVWSAV